MNGKPMSAYERRRYNSEQLAKIGYPDWKSYPHEEPHNYHPKKEPKEVKWTLIDQKREDELWDE